MVDPTGHWFSETLTSICGIIAEEPTPIREAIVSVATVILGVVCVCTYESSAKSPANATVPSTSIPSSTLPGR